MKPLGRLTVELNSKFIVDKMVMFRLVVFFFCLGGTLVGTPQPNMKDAINATRHQLQSHQEQIQILKERLNNQDEVIESVRVKMTKKKESPQPQNKKELSQLSEKVKELQNHAKTTSSSLSTVGNHLNDLEKKFIEQGSQIQKLKQVLEELTQALVEAESETYTVQHGDSLGEIALRHKTTIKAIKEKNHLKNDRINVGQKLLLP